MHSLSIRFRAVLQKAAMGVFLFSVAGSAAFAQWDNAPLAIELEALIAEHKLPGVSVAVVDHYELVYAATAGVKEQGQAAPIDHETAFSAASISKAITGLVAAKLAEQGVLDLDAPVSRYLKRWQLPASPFTEEQPITIRHLLTHTAGTSQSGFADYFPGDDIPTLIESLNGVKLQRDDKPIEIMWAPGSRFKYSGGGYVIAQVAIEDVTGVSLAELAAEMLFHPLGMKNTTMHQNGDLEFLKNVARAHDDDGSLVGPGGVPIYPQTAASGMWTTPTDMAKLMIEIQRALEGRETTVISSWVAHETTRMHTLLKAGGWGMGWMRFRHDGNLDWFAHSGFNSGIGGLIMATMTDGRAIAVFGNGEPRARLPVIDAVIEQTIRAAGWKQELRAADEPPARKATQQLLGYYQNINGGYFSPFHEVVSVFRDGRRLMLDNSLGMRAPLELVHVGEGRFRIDNFKGSAFGPLVQDGTAYLAFFDKEVDEPGPALEKLPAGQVPPYEVARTHGFDAGLAAYTAWQATMPDSALLTARYFTLLAKAATDNGKNAQALTFYQLGAHFHDEDAAMQMGMATAYLTAGDPDGARAAARRVLALNPPNEEAKAFLTRLDAAPAQ